MIKALLDLDISRETLKDKKEINQVLKELKTRFPDISENMEADEEHQSSRVKLKRDGLGLNIDNEFLSSPDFREFKSLYATIREFGTAPYKVKYKDDIIEFSRARHMFEHILSIAKKGISIQRYKGLGEMNPAVVGDDDEPEEEDAYAGYGKGSRAGRRYLHNTYGR